MRQVLDVVGVRVTAINETTRTAIQQIVGNSLTEGTTIADLADKIEEQFDQTWNGRAEAVARTESQVAYNTASAKSFEESGLVSEIELLDNDKHTDSYGAEDGWSCSERNGQVVPLADAALHIRSEHINGSMAIAPVLTTPLGEV